MTIISAVANTFKQECTVAKHNLTAGVDSIKCALYVEAASLGANTTVWTPLNEVSGTGYTIGGVAIAAVTPVLVGPTVVFDFADATWAASTFTTRGALLYNASKGNAAIAVIDFGGNQTVSSGTFTVQWPTPDANNAIIRLT